MYHRLFIHSAIDGHLNYSQFRAILYKSSLSIHIEVFYVDVFHFSWVNTESRIVGGKIHVHLTSSQTSMLFAEGGTILHSHPQWMEVPADQQRLFFKA